MIGLSAELQLVLLAPQREIAEYRKVHIPEPLRLEGVRPLGLTNASLYAAGLDYTIGPNSSVVAVGWASKQRAICVPRCRREAQGLLLFKWDI